MGVGIRRWGGGRDEGKGKVRREKGGEGARARVKARAGAKAREEGRRVGGTSR